MVRLLCVLFLEKRYFVVSSNSIVDIHNSNNSFLFFHKRNDLCKIACVGLDTRNVDMLSENLSKEMMGQIIRDRLTCNLDIDLPLPSISKKFSWNKVLKPLALMRAVMCSD